MTVRGLGLSKLRASRRGYTYGPSLTRYFYGCKAWV